jgi:PAS domain S-box-containing protein
MYSVLYVDDEENLLELGKLFLEHTGDFQVETVKSATGGLDVLNTRSFDAIISDYQMPEMDGIVFLKEIRSRHGDLPFILFTGKGREEVVIQAINHGADFYLQKGGQPEAQFAELGHKIQQAVQRKRAENALRINEERLSMAQSIGGIGSWELDPVTKKLWGSPEAFRIFGYPATDDGTISLEDAGVCITDRERVRLALKNLIENGEEYNLEYSISPADGSDRKIIHSVGKIHRDTSGNIIKISGVIQDITIHKKNETQIIQEREKFHKILSTAPVGILIVDEEYVITQANKYISSILSREPDDIIGKRAGSGLGCVHSAEHTEGCGFSASCPGCPLRMALDSVRKEGKSLNGAVIDLTLLIDGEPRYRCISVNAEPIELEGSRFTIISVDDMTSQMEYEEERIRKSDELSAAYEQIAATEEELRQNYDELAASQQLLQESRQVLQSIVMGSPIPTFVIDNEHRVTSWNMALADYLGIPAEAIIGKPLAGQAFYKTDRPSLADLIVDQAPDEIPKWYDGKYSPSSWIEGAYEVTDFFPTMKGGTWLFFTASPIYDDAGGLIGAIETLQDITLRKQAEEKLTRANEELNVAYEELAATEEELRQNLDQISSNQSELLESEQRFRSAMNHLPGTAWAVDLDLRYTLSQGAGLTLIGLKPDQVVGMTLYEFFSTSDPEHPVISQHLRAISGEEIVYDFTHEGVSFRTYLSPQRDYQGTITGVNGLAFDITELKKAEEENKKKDSKFRILIEASTDVIWQVDLLGNFTYVSPQCLDLTGYSPADLIGKPMVNLVAPDRIAELITLFTTSIKEKRASRSLIVPIKHRDGHLIDLEIRSVVIVDDNGEVRGFGGIALDITERKKAEDALHQANRKLNLLSGITRHDINNQLSVLVGYLGILQKNPHDPALDSYFQKASNTAERILSIIRFTKLYEEIGVRAPSWENCWKIVDIATKEAPLGNVRVCNDLPSGNEVFADPLILKVFYNLMDNAVRYGGNITTIRFFVEQAGGNHIIICEDDGNGIPADEKEKIFDRGFGKNTGLGLALSREILDITGIRIRETGEPGKGARFEITVPKEMWRITVTGKKLPG